MDAKPITLSLCTCLLLFWTIACEKKETKRPVIVDDDSSQYAGKPCYGSSKTNQYILSYSDGTMAMFNGTRVELEKTISRQTFGDGEGLGHKQIKFVEQDRDLNFEGLYLQEDLTPSSGISPSGIFWQVWGQEDAQVNFLWDQNIKGLGVTVAVIDAGIDQSHPALANRIAINENEIPNNGIDDDQNGIIDDYKGFDFAYREPNATPSSHGSHVAGVIAAEPKDSPMLGVAPAAKLLPLNIMGDRGGGSLSAAVFAIKYAESRGAKVINASWGGAVCAEILKQVIWEVGEKGILFVAAAGNDGVDIDVMPEFPAAFGLNNQITVGASVQSGLMAAFSNYSRNHVHILAPGHQILSTVPGGWQVASGTSMAAPFVSGLAALLWSAHPEASMELVRRAIINSAVAPQEYHPVVGQGRINAQQSLKKLEAYLKDSNTF